ncbi:blue-light-activated protein [Methylobacterium phyllosphaerae]|uniref:histidine kinase n=1 Tax=Methylobacterium phyllosphaerae TaxID=418223 RepID=A0AAE8L8L3_9HYPH|nr:PAS domain S-box protein [Methylobacterium phyllosphaerae]APT34756.1 blue-light-activated protein [Methylobacterium phyllosphaerae]SFH42747.1 PAS domain S-box-containing protein [Methylobacterium phyllosphaerae]
METDFEDLRRQLADAKAEIERLRRQNERHVHAPTGDERTSAAGTDLLFTAAEKTRMPQIVTDPNLPDNPIVFANRAFQELCGYGADELIGRNCRFLQGPGTDPADVAKVRDAVAARRDVVVEILNYHRDGTPFRNELYVSPVFDPDGHLRYFFASQLDVTRFRTEEGRLAESEARYRTLFEAVDAGFCIVEMRYDAAGRAVDYRFVEVNPAFERHTGLRDVAGRWLSEVVPGLERSWLDAYGGVALTGEAARFESGAVALGRWFDVHALRIGEPARRRVAILFNDITERREAERVLEETARDRTDERDMVWRTSRDLFLVCGFDGRYRSVNPAWTETLGWSEDDLVGAHFDTFIDPADRSAVEGVFGDLVNGIVLDGLDVRMRTRDGGFRWLSWYAIPRDDHFYAAGRDVTERKALEEQLRQSQKLEAVGQLTGGVAHDFNNLLTVIKSSTDLLKRPNLAEERRIRYVDAISDTVDRAAKLTGQLLAFARRQALQPEVFDVGRGVASVSDMVRTLTGSRIHVETQVEPFRDARGREGPCLVDADPSQFDTALVNMVVNARDAMSGEGRITIRVRPVGVVPAIRAHPAMRGDFVAVSVADTGNGIAPDVLDRIFEPFFTTKGVGQGTGLGLSQVFGFAKQSGGEVIAESRLGEGATFTLYLPRAKAAAAAEAEANEPADLAEGHGTCVLLVEDNHEVGAFAAQALEELGYSTVWAMDAEKALNEFERIPYRFEVVFSDVVMPGMNGVDLARELRRRRPDLPVVLTSGYSEVLAEQGTHGFELLRKPYSVADLSRILRRAVGGVGTGAR